MRIHFSSASTLALATAATLALPLSASAEDFVVRAGIRVAASLEAPVEQPKPQDASANDYLNVKNGETATNNGELNHAYAEGGKIINNGKVTYFTVSKDGEAVNNQNGEVGRMTTGGKAWNAGKIYTVQNGGEFMNAQGGTVTNLRQSDGTFINEGTVEFAQADKGTITNRSQGTIKELVVSRRVFDNGNYREDAATVNNEGRIGSADVSRLGTLNNNLGGVVDVLKNAGTVLNEGQIGSVTQTAGNLTNNGIILGKTTLEGGILTNKKSMGTLETSAGTTFLNDKDGQLKSLTNNGISTNNGAIQFVTQLGGTFTNDVNGTVSALSQEGGVSANDGKIALANVKTGTLTNNASGTIERVNMIGGMLLSSGKLGEVDVSKLAALTNNLSGVIETLVNAGTVTNAGQIGSATQTAGSLTNNGTILGEALINGGTLTNNNAIGSVTIANGANFVNNKGGIARALTNSGTASNDGSIRFVDQKAGTLVNEANGVISGLIQSGGIVTNNGTIERLNVEGGTLANNKDAMIGDAVVSAGTVQNSGAITNLSVGKDGTFANNATGTVDKLSSSGKGSNGGKISNLAVLGGEFNNSGTVTENVTVGGGVFSSTGIIGGALNNLGQSNIAGTINGGISNALNATLNLTGKLTGKGNISNFGTINSTGARDVTGFDTLNNAGVMNIADDLSVSGNVISSGTIRLTGNNTGGDSLTVGGDLSLTSRSVTAIDIVSDGTSDTLTAGGDLTLGGTLNVTANGKTYGLKSTFDAFTSTAGDVAGRFTNVIVSGATSLFGTIEESANGLVLAIRNRDVLNTQLETLDLGENGKILTDLNYLGTEGAQLFDTLATVKADEAPGLIAQITGAASSAVVNVGNSAAQGFGNLMQKVATASGLRRSNDGVLAYEKARQAEEGKFEPVLKNGQGAIGFWARGFGETGNSTGSGDAMIGGIGAGADIAMGQSLTVGASAGYSMARFGSKTALTGNTNSFHAGGYMAVGATAPEATGFGLTASASYSKHETEQERTIQIGTLTSVASANYGGTTIAGDVMVRNGFTLGDKVPLTIAPIAGLKFAMDNDDGYTETGSVANLTVSGAKRRSLVGVVGLSLASRIETESVVFIPHISGVYQHEFLDTSSNTTRTLAGSSTPFTVKQGGGSRSSVAVEAGLGMRFAGGLAVDLSGYGVFSGSDKRYGATATLKAGF